MHVLIVEDDLREKDILEACLARYAAEHALDVRVTWTQSALEFMERRLQADVIFMDIDMPGITGMEAAEHLRTYDETTPLVFVTNLAQYAVHGYAVDALDFIVKPVEYGPFSLRMARVMRALGRRTANALSVSTREGTRTFLIADLVRVEVGGHYLHYVLASGEVLRSRGSMREAETELAPHGFVRISNSDLVNARHVRRVHKDAAELGTGETFYFSRARRRDAQEQIARLLGGGWA